MFAISVGKIFEKKEPTKEEIKPQLPRELPKEVKSFGKKVYKNLEVSKSPVLKDELIENINVNFKVQKSWLTENELNKNQIALHHYADDQWEELETSLGEEDETYVHYSAGTPGFSYFVIAEKETGAVAEPSVEEVAEKSSIKETVKDVVKKVVESPEEETGQNLRIQLTVLMIAVLVIVAVIFFSLRRKKERK